MLSGELNPPNDHGSVVASHSQRHMDGQTSTRMQETMKVEAPLTDSAVPLQKRVSSLTTENRTGEAFSVSEGEAAPPSAACTPCLLPFASDSPPPSPVNLERTAGNSPQRAAAAYRRAGELKEGRFGDDLSKYKDDQLLRSPGGDAYDLTTKTVAPSLDEQRSFVPRVGKDLSDAWGNCKLFLQNLAFGSEVNCREASGQIKTTRQKGLLGTLTSSLKNTLSGLSFGLWTPGGETKPSGVKDRFLHFMRKTKEAFLGDLMQGVPASINRMGKNLVLAGWNLTEVLPDATLGQFDAGRSLTTTIFDNGQIVVEYLTDVLPSGDAWMRVHAGSLSGFKLPILYNLTRPESSVDDARWETVRNTPFRKSIETVGALLADVVAIGFIGQTLSGGHKRDQG
jgi:hypothetical protein